MRNGSGRRMGVRGFAEVCESLDNNYEKDFVNLGSSDLEQRKHCTHYPPRNQVFFFQGTMLEGSRPISEYNIQQLSQVSVAIKRPEDLSTQVGCFQCLTVSLVDGEYTTWLCEACAANAAIAGEFDPTDYTGGPPRKRCRTR